MQMLTTEILGMLFGAGVAGAWFWYDKKKTDKEIEDLKIKNEKGVEKLQTELKEINMTIVKHTSIHVTEEKSRQIAEEICGRIEKDVTETKTMVQSMMHQVTNLASTLQTHTAVQRALQEQNLISKPEPNKK